jgi:hypothetical protein
MTFSLDLTGPPTEWQRIKAAGLDIQQEHVFPDFQTEHTPPTDELARYSRDVLQAASLVAWTQALAQHWVPPALLVQCATVTGSRRQWMRFLARNPHSPFACAVGAALAQG